MDLTSAETTLIDILRDRAGPVFTVSITKTGEGVVVTWATPSEGVHIGAGESFAAAFYNLCGVEAVADRVVSGGPIPSQH